MSSVGFIGLGAMGQPMARNLLSRGHQLRFFARRDDVAAEFSALGARRLASPAEVTAESEYVVTIVTADPQLREVTLGPEGMIEAAAPGKVLLEMSTVSPRTEQGIAAALAERGMQMLDAPVSGGPWGAQAGTLAIMCGGSADVFERARPVLEAMGSPERIFHVGPLGSGQTVKLINQMLGGAMMALIGEGLSLAKASGVDLDKLADVVAVSSGNSSVFEARARKFVLARMFTPGFKTSLMAKDIDLAVALAREHQVSVPVAAAAQQQYAAALGMGLDEEDFAAVVKVNERLSGRTLTSLPPTGALE